MPFRAMVFTIFNMSETQDALLQECAGTRFKPEFKKLTVRGDAFSQSMNKALGFCNPTLGDSSVGVLGQW